MTAPPATDLERLAIDTVRTLSMDAVQAANSGHPGMPMAMAPLAYVLFREVMNHDPKDPAWPDRDRFVLSAGHGSMWLYSALHLSGYGPPLDDIKQFRQWGSITPGHPERDRVHVTPGVEVTTGPLGQGFANGVGLTMAERFLRERYGSEVQDHRTYVICSDGDLMEGIASEAASLAGQLGLGRMVYMYDDNSISLDGPTSLSFDSEDVTGRFEAYRWHVQTVDDVNDLDALRAAIKAAQEEEERPSLIRVKTIIGWPAPNKMGTSKAHGSALGEDEVRLAKEALGWDPDAHFLVPDGVYEAFSAVEKGRRGARGVDGALPRMARRRRGPRRRVGRRLARRADARLRGVAAHVVGQGQDRDALGGPADHGRLREDRPDDGRRRGGPERVDEDRVPGREPGSPATTRAATCSSACASTAWAAR